MSVLEVSPARRLSGRIAVPGDKSLTHRSLLFGGVSGSVVHRPLLGEDCLSTAACLRALGCEVTISPERITVVAPPAWLVPDGPLDCGNSGTTMRLLSGMLAARGLTATLVGDASLSRRPMGRIADPLRRMGARVEGDRPPLRLLGGDLTGIAYESPVASAQVKSCVLLAGLGAAGETSVSEPALSRDHTERMLRGLGVDVRSETLPDGRARATLAGGGTWDAFETTVPGDVSSAAFWLVAAAIVPGSALDLLRVGVNPTRTGVLDVLSQVGVGVEHGNAGETMGEPVADLRVSSGERRPFRIEGALVPRLVDEIPALAVLATQCEGETVIRDARELRVKETDRIAVVTQNLRAMGARVEPTEDGMVVQGPTPLRRAVVDAAGDHRIGMAFAVAGLIAEAGVRIENADSIATSYPDFARHLAEVSQS